MKETLIEIKNNVQGNNSRVIKTKNQFNDLEHKETKKQPIRTTRRKKNPNNQDSVSNFWDNFKRSNIHIIGVSEGEEKEQEIGTLFENKMKEKFPNLVKPCKSRKHRESQTRWMQRDPHQDTS